MSTPPEQPAPHGQSPWSRPSVLLSGAFLLLLILAGIIIAVSGGGGGHHTTTKPPAAQGSTTSSSTSGVNSTACTLPAGDQTIPSASPPAGTTWTQVGAMSVPQAPAMLGPQRMSGPWPTCFARNPSGALLSLMNFVAAGSNGDPAKVLRSLATGVPVQLPPCDKGGSLDQAAGGPVQIAGYRYESYTPERASAVLALKAPRGFLGVALTAKWVGDDWRVQYPPGGCASASQLSDLGGYVQWSAF
jgi:hypothetical protein